MLVLSEVMTKKTNEGFDDIHEAWVNKLIEKNSPFEENESIDIEEIIKAIKSNPNIKMYATSGFDKKLKEVELIDSELQDESGEFITNQNQSRMSEEISKKVESGEYKIGKPRSMGKYKVDQLVSRGIVGIYNSNDTN